MTEYLITFEISTPNLFGIFSRIIHESRVFEAKNAKKAIEMADKYMMQELRRVGVDKFDLEDSGIVVTITDVKKI